MKPLYPIGIAAFIVLVLYVVLGLRREAQRYSTKDVATSICPNGTILTVSEGGRTGNAVWEYLSVFAVAKLHRDMNFVPYVPDGITTAMEQVFEPGTIPNLSELPEPCRNLEPKVEVPMEDKPDFVRKLPKDVKHVNLAVYSARFEEVFEYGFHHVREELRFKRDEVEAVEVKLREIRGNQTVPDGVEPVFVGVYYRGTDYYNSIDLFYKDQYKWYHLDFAHRGNASKRTHVEDITPPQRLPTKILLANISDHNFYSRAMAYFENLYRFVIFVLVTIDDDWLALNLPHLKGRIIVRPFADDMPKDLIILSLCNHTIVNYGTFAMTAAMMNDGTKIVYDLGVPVNFDGVTIAMKAAKYLPNWILMK